MAILISLKKSFIKSIIAIVLYFNLFGFCMYWYDYNRSEWLYGCAYLTVFFLVIKAIKQWNQ
jgi:predicted membrane channel-forming protein YqfA (hemolysin III family)